MSFSDGGEPEPEWEEWMDDPQRGVGDYKHFFWALGILLFLFFVVPFVVAFFWFGVCAPNGCW